MNNENYQIISQNKFIRVIKDNKNDCSYAFLPGAGASISSGVPSAEQLRKTYFDRLIENKTPSSGYQKLVLLLKEQFSKIILTTNFDSLAEKAAIISNSIFPRIITCETSKQVYQYIYSPDIAQDSNSPSPLGNRGANK